MQENNTPTLPDLDQESMAAIFRDTVREMLAPVIELELLARKKALTSEEVERLYSLNAETLRKRRVLRTGPEFIKDGASVLYRPQAVEDYLQARRQLTHD